MIRAMLGFTQSVSKCQVKNTRTCRKPLPSGCASLVCFLVLTTCLMTNLRLFPSPNKTTREDSQDAEIHILRGLKIAHLNINRLVNKLDSLKLIIEKYYFDELLHCQKLGSL